MQVDNGITMLYQHKDWIRLGPSLSSRQKLLSFVIVASQYHFIVGYQLASLLFYVDLYLSRFMDIFAGNIR